MNAARVNVQLSYYQYFILIVVPVLWYNKLGFPRQKLHAQVRTRAHAPGARALRRGSPPMGTTGTEHRTYCRRSPDCGAQWRRRGVDHVDRDQRTTVGTVDAHFTTKGAS